ncbi:hypothetical protein TIFTF001_008894 [Ficus carica]|uniref:Uncharacterized protein n=1 Tax=Ficus carica TaxID=3494 RepID=A0AA87ZTT1_FICCA|nr:hypothetical protein TIFTF001_008894 [Ficus carica]
MGGGRGWGLGWGGSGVGCRHRGALRRPLSEAAGMSSVTEKTWGGKVYMR